MNTQTKNRPSRSGSGASQRRTSSSRNAGRGKFNGGGSRNNSNSNRGGRSRNGSSRGNRGSYSSSRNSRGNRGGSGRKQPTFNPLKFINTNPVEAVEEEVYVPKNTFATFGVNKKFVEDITKLGLETPSPIQDQIIPEILNGNDVIGLAETGTGKTAAFLIPLIEKTLKDHTRQTLILAPTRELAIQIEDEFKKLARSFKLYSVVCVGGTNIRPQINALRRKNHFVIGTPGRILDLINRKSFLPAAVTTVVLDEADRMLDMGFIHDMKTILSSTPSDRETLFFSATMPNEAKKLVHEFLNNPVAISVKKKDVTNSIEQDVVRYNNGTKYDVLFDLLRNSEFNRVIVFGAMKHSVEKLSRQLSKDGVKAESIHGNKSHGQRQRSLTKFKSGNARVLVATDVAARGIHVDNVTHVINYDLPNTFEDYVHRIGRTGRATNKGKALTFVQS